VFDQLREWRGVIQGNGDDHVGPFFISHDWLLSRPVSTRALPASSQSPPDAFPVLYRSRAQPVRAKITGHHGPMRGIVSRTQGSLLTSHVILGLGRRRPPDKRPPSIWSHGDSSPPRVLRHVARGIPKPTSRGNRPGRFLILPNAAACQSWRPPTPPSDWERRANRPVT